MSVIWFLLPLFFIIWGFFVNTTSFCLSKLGEYRAKDTILGSKGKNIYIPFHNLIFKSQDYEVFLFATKMTQLIGVLLFSATSLLALYFQNFTTLYGIAIAIVALFLCALLFLVFFPYLIALKNSEKGLRFSIGVTSLCLFITLPLSFLFLKSMEKAARQHEEEEKEGSINVLTDAVLEILQKANVKGKLSSIDKKLIESVIKFKERIVKEVMVPRVDLFCLPATISIRDAAFKLMEEGYSRVPVYKGNIDNIIGVLMFKDILDLYMEVDAKSKDPSLLNHTIELLIKRPFYTPETKKASQLLQEFRVKQMHMAIVVDEYGGTEGVVTIEDILEEIVGDIADEYDVDEEELYTAQPGEGSWVVDARMNILDAEETFGIQIPQEGDYDTIGGYLFHRFGSIPKPGQKIHNEEFDLEILSSSERSVEKVRITTKAASK